MEEKGSDTERELNTSMFSEDEGDLSEDSSSDESLRYVQFYQLHFTYSNIVL